MVTSINYDSINHLDTAHTESISEIPNKDHCFHSNFINKLTSIANAVKTATVNAAELGRSAIQFVHTNFVKQINNIFNLFKSEKQHPDTLETAPICRQKPIDNKEVKAYINEQIEKLEISTQGKKDTQYVEQTIDSILASVYSERKDVFCMTQVNLQQDIPESYLREIGEAARECGLAGTEKKGIFKPTGAGANPFLTAVMSPVTKRYPYRLLNRNQDSLFKNYAKEKIYQEVGKMCEAHGRVNPSDFNARLENIAQKYMSPSES